MSAPDLLGKRARLTHVFPRQSEEHYVEPASVSERLFDFLALPNQSIVLDPACGFGRIVRAAAARGHSAYGSDIVARWERTPDGPHVESNTFFQTADFFGSWPPEGCSDPRPDLIASNPPFSRAQEFATLAMERAVLVALLLPTKWLNGNERSAWRRTTPLHLVMPISPRPSMPPGHVLLAGHKAGGGTVDFSWFVWLRGYRGKPILEDLPAAAGKAVAA